MADVIYLAIIFAFFGLATVLVRACERIIGPDELAAPARGDEPHEPERLAA